MTLGFIISNLRRRELLKTHYKYYFISTDKASSEFTVLDHKETIQFYDQEYTKLYLYESTQSIFNNKSCLVPCYLVDNSNQLISFYYASLVTPFKEVISNLSHTAKKEVLDEEEKRKRENNFTRVPKIGEDGYEELLKTIKISTFDFGKFQLISPYINSTTVNNILDEEWKQPISSQLSKMEIKFQTQYNRKEFLSFVKYNYFPKDKKIITFSQILGNYLQQKYEDLMNFEDSDECDYEYYPKMFPKYLVLNTSKIPLNNTFVDIEESIKLENLLVTENASEKLEGIPEGAEYRLKSIISQLSLGVNTMIYRIFQKFDEYDANLGVTPKKGLGWYCFESQTPKEGAKRFEAFAKVMESINWPTILVYEL